MSKEVELTYDSLGWYWKDSVAGRWYGPFPTRELAKADSLKLKGPK